MNFVKIKEHLVYSAPDKLPCKPLYKGSEPIFKNIEMIDLEKDPWLSVRKIVFSRFLNEGHIGHHLVDPITGESVAYGWTAVNGNKPGHLPSVPPGVCWSHYVRVRDAYQGRGYQRLLLFNRLLVVKERFKDLKIFADTSRDNFASRINMDRMGFEEAGVYHVVTIGTKRVPYFYWQWGKWNREEKHSPLVTREDPK